MTLKSLDDEFAGYFAMCFPKGCPSQAQEAETKQAFFAGAWAMWCGTAEIGLAHVSVNDGMAYLEARRAEMEAFKKQLMTRYAESN